MLMLPQQKMVLIGVIHFPEIQGGREGGIVQHSRRAVVLFTSLANISVFLHKEEGVLKMWKDG